VVAPGAVAAAFLVAAGIYLGAAGPRRTFASFLESLPIPFAGSQPHDAEPIVARATTGTTSTISSIANEFAILPPEATEPVAAGSSTFDFSPPNVVFTLIGPPGAASPTEATNTSVAAAPENVGSSTLDEGGEEEAVASLEIGDESGSSPGVALSSEGDGAELEVSIPGVVETGASAELELGDDGATIGASLDLGLLGEGVLETEATIGASSEGVTVGLEVGDTAVAIQVPLNLPLLPPGDDEESQSSGGLLGGLFGH
jgi:hypothetical protein